MPGMGESGGGEGGFEDSGEDNIIESSSTSVNPNMYSFSTDDN